MITAADEDAIRHVPADAWKPGTAQDGTAEEDKDVAEITHLMSRAGNWPDGLRWIARRVKPSRRQMRNLTDWEKKTGWRYSITCTNIPGSGIAGVPGQPPPPVHRHRPPRARLRGDRRGPHRQGHGPARPPVENLAGQRRLGHRREHRRRPGRLDPPPRLLRRRELREADPDTLRYRVWHIPARLARHARKRILGISPDWPWAECIPRLLGAAMHPARTRLTSTNHPTTPKEGHPGAVGAGAHPGAPGTPRTAPARPKQT